MLAADLLDRPPRRPRGQLRPRRGDVLVLLHERPDRTGRLRAHPTPLAPHDPHRPTERRRIDKRDLDPAVGVRDNPAPAAAHHTRRRLHRHNGDPADLSGYTPTLSYRYDSDQEATIGGTILSAYVQDVWQPIDRLTLRPGLRLDAPTGTR